MKGRMPEKDHGHRRSCASMRPRHTMYMDGGSVDIAGAFIDPAIHDHRRLGVLPLATYSPSLDIKKAPLCGAFQLLLVNVKN
ncbi:MAG: hypothetical protein OQL16_09995 [Gammaproteobacteria bacterium]|nr:hypothetical protein [Gammaproteobacteria bacterium]